MSRRLSLAMAFALLPVAASAQVTSLPASPGPGFATSAGTLSVIFGTAAGTAAQGNDSRITGSEQMTNKGAAGGYPGLDGSGELPLAFLPSFTADELGAANPMAGTDNVLLRQGGTTISLGTLSAIQSYVLGGLINYNLPVISADAPTTIGATANNAVVTVTAAGTLTLDPASTADGWHCQVVNASSGTVTLAAGSGGAIAAGGALASLLPGRAVHVTRYTQAGTPTFQLVGGTPAPQISLNPVAGVLAGNPATFAGSFVNDIPSALDYSTNGGSSYSTATSPTIGSSGFSFNVSGLAAGTYTPAVRDHGNQTVYAVGNPFSVAASAQATVNTPPSTLMTQAVPVSGAYLGTPAAIQAAYDSATNWTTIAASPSGGTFLGTLAAPAVGSHTVRVRFSDGSVTSASSGSFAIVGVPTIIPSTPADVAHGANAVVSYAFQYDATTGADWSLNGGSSWTTCPDAAPSNNAGAGNGTCTIAGLADGYYSASLRLDDTPTATGSTSPFPVGNAIWLSQTSQTVVGGATVSITGKQSYASSLNWEFVTPPFAAGHVGLSGTGTKDSQWTTTMVAPAAPGTYAIELYDFGNLASAVLNLTTTAPSTPTITLDPTVSNMSANYAALTFYGEYDGLSGPLSIQYTVNPTQSLTSATWLSDGTVTDYGNGHWKLVLPPQANGTSGSYYFSVRLTGYTNTAYPAQFVQFPWNNP